MSDRLDRRLLEQDGKIAAIRRDVDFFIKTALPLREGIFFEGQIFDAYAFVAGLIRNAKSRIVVIDSYVDESVYHIGHSLKDLGKKLFAFSKMDVMTGSALIARL